MLSWVKSAVPLPGLLSSPSALRSRQPLKTANRGVGRRKRKSDLSSGKGPLRNSCYSEEKLAVRLRFNPGRGWTEYTPPIIDRIPKKPFGLVRFKVSENWYASWRLRKSHMVVPFIDHEGFIHATASCIWRCTEPQLLATIVSTVLKRLRNVVHNQHHKYRANPDLLAKIGRYYSITNDDSFFRRCLAMIRQRVKTKHLRDFVYYKIKHMDENKRFLFDQVHYATLWLQSRIRRCPIRAKSRHDDRISSTDTPPTAAHGIWGPECIKNFVDTVTAWGGVYSIPDCNFSRAVNSLHLGGVKSLPFFRG